MRRIRFAIVVAAALAATGCNTIAGIGRDMSTAAQWTGERLRNGFADRTRDPDLARGPVRE